MPPMESPEETVAREAAEAAAVAAQNGDAVEVHQTQPGVDGVPEQGGDGRVQDAADVQEAMVSHEAEVAEQAAAAEIVEPAKSSLTDADRAEIDARLKEHLKDVCGDIGDFLDDEVGPLKEAVDALTVKVDALTQASPESISGLVAEMEGLRQQVSDMASKLKHWI